jgi:hypothetical protein
MYSHTSYEQNIKPSEDLEGDPGYFYRDSWQMQFSEKKMIKVYVNGMTQMRWQKNIVIKSEWEA